MTTVERVATAVALASRLAEVRLSHSEWEDVLSVAEEHTERLRAIEEFARLEARSHYGEAMSEWLNHVSAVIENNADKSFTQIMTRSDVMGLFGEVLAQAQERSEGTMKGAWLSGWTTGRSHAKVEAALYGLNPAQTAVLAEHPFLASLMADLEANTSSATARYANAAQNGFAGLGLPDLETLREQYPVLPDNVRKDLAQRRAAAIRNMADAETRDLSNRVGAGTSVAVERSYSEAQLAEYGELAKENPLLTIKKMWHTNFSPTTCGWCAAHHGTVLSVEQSFNGAHTFAQSGSGPGVYQDLQVPPRHPNCHCRVVMFIEEGTADTEVEPADLQQAARDWADQQPSMTSQSFGTPAGPSTLSQTTDFMEAADLRQMSEARFNKAIELFKGCVLQTNIRPKKP